MYRIKSFTLSNRVNIHKFTPNKSMDFTPLLELMILMPKRHLYVGFTVTFQEIRKVGLLTRFPVKNIMVWPKCFPSMQTKKQIYFQGNTKFYLCFIESNKASNYMNIHKDLRQWLRVWISLVGRESETIMISFRPKHNPKTSFIIHRNSKNLFLFLDIQ